MSPRQSYLLGDKLSLCGAGEAGEPSDCGAAFWLGVGDGTSGDLRAAIVSRISVARDEVTGQSSLL